MGGLEIVAGYLMAWSVRKTRRVTARLDAEADRALDTALERLHTVVTAKLGDDPAIVRLQAEVTSRGDAAPRTRRRVNDAVADAADEDPAFARELGQALFQLGGVPSMIAGVDLRGAQGVQVGNHNVQSIDLRTSRRR